LGFALAAAFALSGAVAHAAQEPLVLQPASPWQMDYADDSCALRRLFTAGETRVVLDLRQFAPDSSIMATVMADGLSRTQRGVTFRYEPSAEWRDAGSALYTRPSEKFKEFSGFIFTADILPDDEPMEDDDGRIESEKALRQAQAFKDTTGFSVARGFGREITLKTGPLGAPHEAMRTCLEELTAHWGIDAEAHKSLTRRAVPKDAHVIVRRLQQDYPLPMLQQGLSGLIRFRLSIDDKGAVSGCHVQLDISHPEFERAACENVARVKFLPALDKSGKPIASYWVNSVVYEIM
jgi:hypothetical protein